MCGFNSPSPKKYWLQVLNENLVKYVFQIVLLSPYETIFRPPMVVRSIYFGIKHIIWNSKASHSKNDSELWFKLGYFN